MSLPSRVKLLPPPVLRSLYRSMLRVCEHGNRPEVFGHYGGLVYSRQIEQCDEHPSLALPSTARQVRQRLKAEFRQDHGKEPQDSNPPHDPFEILRHAHLQSAILPQTLHQERLPASLPIFEGRIHGPPAETSDDSSDEDGALVSPTFNATINSSTLLPIPGETVHFVLPESTGSGLLAAVSESNGYFLWRPRGTDGGRDDDCVLLPHRKVLLMKLISSQVLGGWHSGAGATGSDPGIGRRVALAGLAGGRVRITGEDAEPSPSEGVGFAARFRLLRPATREPGSEPPEEEDFGGLRQYVLNMLHHALPYQRSSLPETLSFFGLPPLDPESFSFWALRYVLAPGSVRSRRSWVLDCDDTRDRLAFVRRDIEEVCDQDRAAPHDDPHQQEEEDRRRQDESSNGGFEEEDEECPAAATTG